MSRRVGAGLLRVRGVIGQIKCCQWGAELSSHFHPAFFLTVRPYAVVAEGLAERKMRHLPQRVAAPILPFGGCISVPADIRGSAMSYPIEFLCVLGIDRFVGMSAALNCPREFFHSHFHTAGVQIP